MKTLFPAGSTAFILILLALIAQLKGCSMGYEVIRKADTTSEVGQAQAPGNKPPKGQSWFHARTILLGAGSLCALYWFRNRMRRRMNPVEPKIPFPTPTIQTDPRRIIRRRRR